MDIKRIFSALPVIAVMVLSCNREAPEIIENQHIVRISVQADKTLSPSDDPQEDTKLGYDWKSNSVSWEPDDKIQILFSKWTSDAHSASWNKNVVIGQVEGESGLFAGEIDLSNPSSPDNPFEYTDIKGVVVVKKPVDGWCSRRVKISNDTYLPICLDFILDQVQEQAGVFSSDSTFPFYSGIIPGTGSNATSISQTAGGEIKISNLKLVAGCAIWEYHIYADAGSGTDPGYASEKIQSIETSVSGSAMTCIHVNRVYFNETDNGARRGYNSSNAETGSVTLVNPAALPTSREEAAVLWHSVPNSTPKTLTQIKVTTDRAVYTKTFTSKTIKSVKGNITPLYMNLAGFDRIEPELVMYSADGGANWSETMPETFSSLAVMTQGGATLKADDIVSIKSAMSSQSVPVTLDLGAAEYESETFPAIFKGTADSPETCIKGIKFPSNVKTVASSAFAYCSSLEEVDLTGIEYLSPSESATYNFRQSGLKTLVIPSSMTGYMDRSFVNCYELESIYYNASWASRTGYNYRTFQWGAGNNTADSNPDAQVAKSRDLVLTIGPDAVNIPLNSFRNNHNLSKVVVEASEGFTFLNNCFYNCDNLAEFDLQGEWPPKIAAASVYSLMGTDVADGSRKIYVPAGKLAAWKKHANWPAWETMASARGYTIIDPGIVYPSASGWEDADPADYNFDAASLEAVKDLMYTDSDQTGPTSLFVTVGGKCIFKAGTYTETSRYIASCRKSILAMLYGKYLENGTIDRNETVESWMTEAGYKEVIETDTDGSVTGTAGAPITGTKVEGLLDIETQATVWNLITARSGVYHTPSQSGDASSKPVRGTKTPGEYQLYNNWDFNAAGAVFAFRTGKTVFDALETDLALPVGFEDWKKSIQYMSGNTALSIFRAYHMRISARDFARLGYLMLRDGVWEGKQLISKQWHDEMVSFISTPKEVGGSTTSEYGYGVMWWLYNPSYSGHDWKYEGAYRASGSGGQYMCVFPALDMVIAAKNTGGNGTSSRFRTITKAIVESYKGSQP